MLFILYRPSVNCIKLEEGNPCFCLRSDYLDSPRPLNAVDQTRLPPIQQSSLQILFVADHWRNSFSSNNSPSILTFFVLAGVDND